MKLCEGVKSVNQCWHCMKHGVYIVVVMNDSMYPECSTCHSRTRAHPVFSKVPTISTDEAQLIVIKEAL